MEFFDICDEYGYPTGETVTRELAHSEGILHRTAHIWIIRKKAGGYDILLQKRTMNKDSFPGMYDTSSAGHIPAGEEPLPAALRELREELGIDAGPDDLSYIGQFRIQFETEFHGKIFRDNEIPWVYVYKKPVDITKLTLQASEVDEVRWFDLEEVYAEIAASSDRFCVPTEGLETLMAWIKKEYQ